ncbi:RNA deprotection pyrophosphohydrolase [Staphylococcus simiae]|uniref:Nudix hydrolase domain-containing protein n=1 Tax=Staphylococcus simiae CCM 7213 = CCUG 51256 TaxID=911238 RepID=G5JJY0_9STAP|nr:nucleoside triphosphatase YtkD [Staphylococcus simiae]EHJ07535.1 hypothetical protein SS7213T_08957 [Staphylococcus simiae CCM 7213 = CCUG 51256]
MTMKFWDKDQRLVELTYKTDSNDADGNHVLAIPVYNNQLLFTNHKIRGIEFPGGKREDFETSVDAVKRELYEETGATVKSLHYIAQYHIATAADETFIKDVYFIDVDEINEKYDYMETTGPVLFNNINDISKEQQSYLLQDETILTCLERVIALGFYQN